jgi:hypothetical protein
MSSGLGQQQNGNRYLRMKESIKVVMIYLYLAQKYFKGCFYNFLWPFYQEIRKSGKLKWILTSASI